MATFLFVCLSESILVTLFLFTSPMWRGRGTGGWSPGELGAGEGGKREQKLKRHSLLFVTAYHPVKN